MGTQRPARIDASGVPNGRHPPRRLSEGRRPRPDRMGPDRRVRPDFLDHAEATRTRVDRPEGPSRGRDLEGPDLLDHVPADYAGTRVDGTQATAGRQEHLWPLLPPCVNRARKKGTQLAASQLRPPFFPKSHQLL